MNLTPSAAKRPISPLVSRRLSKLRGVGDFSIPLGGFTSQVNGPGTSTDPTWLASLKTASSYAASAVLGPLALVPSFLGLLNPNTPTYSGSNSYSGGYNAGSSSANYLLGGTNSGSYSYSPPTAAQAAGFESQSAYTGQGAPGSLAEQALGFNASNDGAPSSTSSWLMPALVIGGGFVVLEILKGGGHQRR